MKRADDEDAGVARGGPPACGGRVAQMKRADDDDARVAGIEEWRR
jgi:hypothetical protein